MTNRVLDAYEGIKRERQDSFFEIFKKVKLMDKIFCAFYLLISISMVIVILMDKQIIVFWLSLALFVGLCVWTVVSRKNAVKKWNDSIKKYNESLDDIKKLLKSSEYNLYEKNKLKQLIFKFNRDIAELQKEQDSVREKFNHFSSTYIIPVVAFCVGKLFEDLTTNDIIALAVVGILFVILAKAIGYAIGIIRTEIIDDNELERKRYFVKKLQDLLDRDFEINDNDLIQ